MKVYKSVCGLVGGIPILKLNRYCEQNRTAASIYAKLEYFNTAGSAKDRAAKKMLEDAEKILLKKGSNCHRADLGQHG